LASAPPGTAGVLARLFHPKPQAAGDGRSEGRVLRLPMTDVRSVGLAEPGGGEAGEDARGPGPEVFFPEGF